ncbi:sulfotransferase [Chromohalobacter sp. 296-RDG]|uniref:sulfotransferase family protein n=1 Tax=Chromohalobacter sp. 296-RDG TaxID=2994062 RepID=UPI002469A0FA|nr:sulfotransferase [Chromohalobacter sp. 296-RDG]
MRDSTISLIAVGPQRTASSWLDQALRAHPLLALPANVKETFFFDRHYGRGLDWYLSHFESHLEEILKAEVGPTYFESYDARKRIKEHNINTRILITVRSPIARTFSSFVHEATKGRASDEFFKAIEDHPRIVNAGCYAKLAPEWEAMFGCGNVHYVVQENIVEFPQKELDAICDFLGVEHVALPEELYERYGTGTVPRYRWLATAASHSVSTLRGMGLHKIVEAGKLLGLKRIYSGGDKDGMTITRPVFDYLLNEHERDIQFLEARLGRKFPHWRDPNTYGVEG